MLLVRITAGPGRGWWGERESDAYLGGLTREAFRRDSSWDSDQRHARALVRAVALWMGLCEKPEIKAATGRHVKIFRHWCGKMALGTARRHGTGFASEQDQHERISRVHLVRARVSIGFLRVGGHVQRSQSGLPNFCAWPWRSGARVRRRGNQILTAATYLISVSVPASCATSSAYSERKLRIIGAKFPSRRRTTFTRRLFSLKQHGHEIDASASYAPRDVSHNPLGCVYKLVEVDETPRIKLEDLAKSPFLDVEWLWLFCRRASHRGRDDACG